MTQEEKILYSLTLFNQNNLDISDFIYTFAM
jgi:hypothetical protein